MTEKARIETATSGVQSCRKFFIDEVSSRKR